jgi:hypothetical protein
MSLPRLTSAPNVGDAERIATTITERNSIKLDPSSVRTGRAAKK